MNQEGHTNPPPPPEPPEPPPGGPPRTSAPGHREPRGPVDQRGLVTPQGTGTLGMWLFLAALSMLFIASLVGFVIIHLTSDNAPPLHSMTLPWPLWISTGIIMVSSYSIHRALQNVQHERQTRFRNAMTITLMLAGAFLLIQTPSLIWLIDQHFHHLPVFQQGQAQAVAQYNAGQRAMNQPLMPMQGLVFALILIHGLHALGGVIPLGVITAKAHRGTYDHESCGPVKYITMYWHFLDVVWIVMFLTLLIVA